jgi:hypothetical protein
MGDVFHGPPQVSEPSWVFAFDADPDTTCSRHFNGVEPA